MSELYEETQLQPIVGDMNPLMALNLGGSQLGFGGIGSTSQAMANGSALRKNIYSQVLSELRKVMISRMVKPEEVR